MRLKGKHNDAAHHQIGCFNSKLVRLKDPSNADAVFAFEFQFQTGSIKRAENNLGWGEHYKFQFQTGAIKSRLR